MREKPHVRFDEGVQETGNTRRACALLYQSPHPNKALVPFRMLLVRDVISVIVVSKMLA